MRILQLAPPFTDTPPKDYGGTEWVITNLTKGLVKLGHDVTLFATKKSKTIGKLKYIFKASLHELGIPWTAALPVYIHYYEALKDAENYDIVHGHLSSETDLLLLPLLADLTQRNIPNILTIHSRWPYDTVSNMDKVFLKLYAKKIRAVNISASMHNTLPKEFKDGGYVYNSLDVSKMKFSPKSKGYLTWLGKITPEKGTAEAIKIAKAAGRQFIFAGIVDRYKEKSVKYFQTKVKPLIDGKQVRFLGPADLKLKNKLLGGAAAFLNPINWDEPFGMVIVESLSCGTPVISYSRGAIPEIIKDKVTGFLVNTKSQMINSINKIDQISRRVCREYVENHFSPVAAAEKYLELYLKEIRYQRALSERKLRTKAIRSSGRVFPDLNPLFGSLRPSNVSRINRSTAVYLGIDRKN